MSKNRVGLNLQPLSQKSLTGIGTYSLEIAARLPLMESSDMDYEGHLFDFLGRNHSREIVRAHLLSRNIDEEIPLRVSRTMPLGAYIRGGALFSPISYQTLLGSNVRTEVFFNYLKPNRVGAKSIITVYDMVSARFPETMDDRNRRLLTKFLPDSCKKADRIATISEFSKREIVECLHIPEERIFVAPCGVDQTFYSPITLASDKEENDSFVRNKFRFEGRYLLYLGTLEPRKNVGILVDVLEELLPDFEDLRLIIAGGFGWQYQDTLERMQKSRVSDRIILTGYVSEEEKRQLYRSASALLFPSYYEGFGLPVVEAMACGIPVVCSNRASLPEIANDAALLCDPGAPEEFVRATRSILHDQDLAKLLAAKGCENAKRFSWDDAARKYRDAIRSTNNM